LASLVNIALQQTVSLSPNLELIRRFANRRCRRYSVSVAHHPHVVGADIKTTNIITPDDQDIGLLIRSVHRKN
jgi:hypothetical protein